MRVDESEDGGPKERERENIIEVHHKLGIDSVSDAFDVVEMSILEHGKQSPFLHTLKLGRGRARTTAHLGENLAHRVIHDRHFVEVHLTDHDKHPKKFSSAKAGERPRFFHAESRARCGNQSGVFLCCSS